MIAVSAPVFVIGVVLTVLVYAFAVRRLLGLRLSPLRALRRRSGFCYRSR